ncbi:DUF4424 domain-containing protein [Azospirillum sp. RWY-5-1]|uniref:DUF4424 domain-containing protein n=1 Tax=Azospirillum oleiclasticum TaxID=2735135 RepID=A0ABX2T6V1_9PROT|nr:DUF4424 family protein [Azospirillum oleiclasticum]NYZ13273.1 DUF4424 domain-containing protein [Azospirillum oleiclasticum]NYZ20055.1 DUF4424 domain-containing protein [Azospirillum oleiclasticum]
MAVAVLVRCAAIAAALVLPAQPAAANDSTGFQGTTGIELTTTDAIRMVSEDLRIGLDEVRVSYVFRNESDRPIDTLVVFPLPDLDLSLGSTAPNWAFPVRAHDFLEFRLWIDDRPVPAALERRAFLAGRDVTAELAESGALDRLVPWSRAGYDEDAKAIPPATLDRLRARGLIAEGEDTNNPQWVLRNRYHWRQTFPPGVEVRVRHAYRPFVGRALLGKPSTLHARKLVGRLVSEQAATDDRYCFDASTRSALTAVELRHPGEAMPFSAAEIEYILTTARNWRGPIGRFHLTLDKGDPENILSLCWNGLTRTGPTTFEATTTDFVPDRDIRMLVFVRSKP